MGRIKPRANLIREDLQKYPHVPDPKTQHDGRYNPEKYISIQTRVNNDPSFEQAYIAKIASDGWVALKNSSDIHMFPKGRQFKYRLNGESMAGFEEGTFRSGGWLIGKNLEDPENNHLYVMYKGYNGVIFSLQIKDILEVYVKSEKKEIPVFKKPDSKNPTNYPVYLPDPETEEPRLVYYAKDEFNKKRFMNSVKYKKALSLGIWSWSVVFYEDEEN